MKQNWRGVPVTDNLHVLTYCNPVRGRKCTCAFLVHPTRSMGRSSQLIVIENPTLGALNPNHKSQFLTAKVFRILRKQSFPMEQFSELFYGTVRDSIVTIYVSPCGHRKGTNVQRVNKYKNPRTLYYGYIENPVHS
jgi:hypothetical protein